MHEKATAIVIFVVLLAYAPAAGGAEGGATRPGLAFQARSLPGGGHPFALVTADLNADGFIDVAVTNPSRHTVSIYLGRGDGTFAGPDDFPTGRNPRGIVVGDFNGDGFLDLGVNATQENELALHDGLGNGRFAAPRTFPVGGRPFLATAADLNHDGFLDIAVANETAMISVLLGDGTGNFSVTSYSTDKWPSDVASADFNEDGHADLAVTNWGANNVSVLFGTGDGKTFSPPRNFTFEGHSLYSVKAADMDRDGHLDMIWNDIMRNGMYVLYGDGKGDFPRRTLRPAGPGVRSVIAVDLNGDGWLDMASANTHGGSVSLALADGQGGFLPSQRFPVGVRPRMVAAADVTGDERPDLIVTNSGTDNVSVLINNGMTGIPIVPEIVGPPLSKRIIEISGLQQPQALAMLENGDLLIADRGHHRIALVPSGSATIETLAGTGQAGDWGDGGPATEAGLYLPSGLAADLSGNVYIADSGNHRVRRIDVTGTISTLAGSGKPGFSGDGGAATEARLNNPVGLAIDKAGNLYIGEAGRVRKVDPTGTITTAAGGSDLGYGGDGGPAKSAKLGASIPALAFDPSGSLVILDQINGRVRRLRPSGLLDTVAGGGMPGSSLPAGVPQDLHFPFPNGLAVDNTGTLFVSAGTNITRIPPQGAIDTVWSPGTAPSRLPMGLTADREATLYFADHDCNCIQQVSSTGAITTVAGEAVLPIRPASHGSGLEVGEEKRARYANARLHLVWEHKFRSGSDANAPYGVAVADAGDVYVAGDVGSGVDWRVLRLTSDGNKVWQYDLETAESELPGGLTLTADGQVVAAGYQTGRNGQDALVISLSESGKENWRYIDREIGEQTLHAITSDKADNLYLAGDSNRSWWVASLTPTGELRWTYKGEDGSARAIALAGNGDVVIAGNSQRAWQVIRLKSDGTIVWKHENRAPRRSLVRAVGLDASGNALVTGSWRDPKDILRVEKLDADGHSLWAYVDEAGGAIGRGIALDAAGNTVVVGETETDWVLLALDDKANLLWRLTHDGGGGAANRDQAFAVALHPSGDLVVSGSVHPLPPKPPSLGLIEWRIARYRIETGDD
jgi:hypothetical protein